MSFQGLISGSECAAPSNSLSQVLKHTETDRSLQQDRLTGPSSSRLHHLPSSASPAAQSSHDAALARQFFETDTGAPVFAPVAYRPQLPYAVPSKNIPFQASKSPTERWAMGQSKSLWSSEFAQASASPMTQDVAPPPQTQVHISPTYNAGSYYPMMGMPSQTFQVNPPQFVPQLDSKGKGKARAEDFDAAFAMAFDAVSLDDKQAARIVEVTEDNNEEAVKSINGTNGDVSGILDQADAANADIMSEKDLAKWEAEFNQLMSSQREDTFDYSSAMQHAWETSYPTPIDKSIEFDEYGIPKLEPYVFEENNPYLQEPNRHSRLNEAKSVLERNGSLSEAALLLEAAIQENDLGEGGYEAWILLGETRNMDEREDAGMRALLKGVEASSKSDHPDAGMLSLAISFTNESMDKASHTMLTRWLQTRYPDCPVPESTLSALRTNATWDTHTRVTDLFLGLARRQHSQVTMDPDVQVALGVLFYTNAEYDRAKDCFESALSVRPRDYLLWNRLGSSLSNGNKPEEALGAYREALELRPTYTRAIYNVGVACLNIGAYKEAAEHFLSALSMQEPSGVKSSDQIWSTLRRALQAMDRRDLADLAGPDLEGGVNAFRGHGFDF
ncbi:TPR-like protein [Fistulina hepatica ATCC 64428]|uniref:TPR-like protein n=1 Tax=Fistulina hepatica ATCC 64428 TaxID=1128425 RepID=A0A0D7A115_9AGAR|nr:TPR-like protein [Fistulina hepatica ATCC 64428]